nr:uncharacterized protein LOC110377992 isoform X2 [Helicoverpa armigera]
MSVMVKRWYRSRRSQFIIFTITLLCILYYLSLNASLQREPDLDLTRRTGYSNASSSNVSKVTKTVDNLNIHSRTSVIKFIENRIEEALREDKGSGCEIPHLDPFAKEIMQFDKILPPITCKGKDWVRCYHSECRVVKSILETTKNVVCKYQDIIYESDHKYHLGPPTEVAGDKPYILDKSDHVKIKCTGTHEKSLLSSTWVGYTLGFRKSVERKPAPPFREDTLNVLIFGFDSTSKNGFIRKMPKSYKYLKNTVKATILDGYNIVGDGTPAALFPILTGKTELELPDARKKSITNATLDSMPFIFYKLKKDGYRTAYFEDMPWIGTFQYRFKGFHRQPADHYLRSFYLEEANGRKGWGTASKYCIGDTPQFQLMMNITDQFLRLDGKRFGFTFIADITHDNAYMISVADDAMVRFLQTLENRNVFEDTLFILIGDHGPRYAELRNTLQGKLEERLPLVAIRLPDRLVRSRPQAKAQLEENSRVLTTPHDLHATILDVLDWDQYRNPYKVAGADLPRALSLLEPIPKNRSCSEAGIQLHWCACVKWKNVTDPTMIQRTAHAFVEFINSLTESQRSKCVPRTLKSIEWVMSQRPNSKMLSFVSAKDADGYVGKFGAQLQIAKENYQLKVIVGPGHGIYEASMTYLKNEDRFVINSRDISRTNAYGEEPSCISATNPHLNMYCYCKDYVPSD